jgi:hypothetical protein
MMRTLEVWWSPAAQCWRIEDGEMFTYYSIDLVVGHFVNRHSPAQALISGFVTDRHVALRRALRHNAIPFTEETETPVS